MSDLLATVYIFYGMYWVGRYSQIDLKKDNFAPELVALIIQWMLWPVFYGLSKRTIKNNTPETE